MPSLRSITARQVVDRASSSTQLISASDLKQVFSDALLSFSPLAILVGDKSNRTLTQSATNVKQDCRGAYLPGLKDMLGIIDENIRDAARAVGCAALMDNAVPRMDKNGGLICDDGKVEPEEAACAVVMLEWESSLNNLDSVRLIVTGRVKWRVSGDQLVDKIQEQVEWLGRSGLDAFGKTSNLGEKVDSGMIELLWPAPAMSLETHPGLPMLFLGFFGSAFVAIPILASPHILSWQSHLSSGMLMGGQALLVLGCVAARYIVKLQRNTPTFDIPKRGQREWIMIDKAKSPSFFVRRPFPAAPGAQLALGQHLRFNTNYVPRVHAVVALFATVVGFICFYLGAKSSDTKTVLIYIVLFIGANMAKGPVIQNANRPSSITTPKDFDRDPAHGNPTVRYRNFTGDPSSHFHVYSKFVHHSASPALDMQMFCFPSRDLWVMAAHAIKDAVGPYAGNRDLGEKLLQMPVYLFNPDQETFDTFGSPQSVREVEFHGFLLLKVGDGQPQDLFYTAGTEMISILKDTFHRRQLCTDADDSLPVSLLCAFVYACTRMLLSTYVAGNATLPPIRRRGAGCLMDAIEHVTRSTNHLGLAPFADLRAAASAAQTGVVTSYQLKQSFNDSADERIGAAWHWLTSSMASNLEEQLEHYKKRLTERQSMIMENVEHAKIFRDKINRTQEEEKEWWDLQFSQWQAQRVSGRLDALPQGLKKGVAELKVQLKNLQRPWRKHYEHLKIYPQKRRSAQKHENVVKLMLEEVVQSADDLEDKLGSRGCTDIRHPVVMEVEACAMRLSVQLWDIRRHLYQYLMLEGQLNKAVGD